MSYNQGGNNQGGNNQQSTLENIFSYSFPANHLLQISLVKQATAEQNYKKQHFCFITLAPGVKNPDGSRTFDFQQNKVTMKVDIDKMIAMAHAIRNTVNGREAVIGSFSIYVDSSKSSYGQQGAGGKSLFIQRGQDKQQTPQPTLVLFFKVGQGAALGYGMTPSSALALADICEFIGKKGLELEFSRVITQGSNTVTPNPAINNNQPFSVPNQQTPVFNQQAPVNAQAPINNQQAPAFAGFNPDDDIPF
jgi:hypothetical protein